jgi:PAS domain S-box-containing protein
MSNTAVLPFVKPVINDLLDTDFLYHYAPCGYLTYQLDGTILKINHTLKTWLQWDDLSLAKGKKFEEMLSTGKRFYYQMVVLPMLNINGFANEISLGLTTISGKTLHCLFTASVVRGTTGEIALVNCIFLKNIDRKKYEAELLRRKQQVEVEKDRFQFLANSIPQIIFTASVDGKLDFLNDVYFQYSGIRKKGYDGNLLLQIVHPADRSLALKAWKNAMATGEDYNMEVQCRNAEGEYEWFLMHAVLYRNIDDEPEMWIGSCTNINEHKQKEKLQLDRLSNSLTKADNLISKQDDKLKQIAFEQSHLVRAPLSNVLGLAQLFKELKEEDEKVKVLTLLEQSAIELDRVVRKIVHTTL